GRGGAGGDAVGAAVEFRRPGSFAPVTGYRGGGPHRLEAGEWTDDTSTALALAELLRAGLDLCDRHAAGAISRHGLAVARGRLENQLTDLVFPPKTNAANERLAQHLWAHRDDLFTFLRQPGLDATNWQAEFAIRLGRLLR